MRIIKKIQLAVFAQAHPQGEKPLLRWFHVVRRARWRNLVELRGSFPSAEEITVKSGRKAVVFNIKNNAYRLITAVHYEKSVKDVNGEIKRVEGKVYLFYFLTHPEYDQEHWKSKL